MDVIKIAASKHDTEWHSLVLGAPQKRNQIREGTAAAAVAAWRGAPRAKQQAENIISYKRQESENESVGTGRREKEIGRVE